MIALQTILDDLKRGENLDLYVNVCAAVFVAVISLFGIAPATVTTSVTLAVLALLAVSSLGDRHRIDKILDRVGEKYDTTFLEVFPPEYKADIESARELIILDVSLFNILEEYYSIFEQKLKCGDKIKILIVHPEGSPIEMAVSRALWDTDTEQMQMRINATLRTLGLLKTVAPIELEFRTIMNPLPYAAILINPRTTGGIIYMENYPYKSPKVRVPKHIFYNSEQGWFRFYQDEILRLWENGIEEK